MKSFTNYINEQRILAESNNQKYELYRKEGNLWRIRTLRDIKLKTYKVIKAGTLGGLVENENNLSQEGTCWIFPSARVTDNASVKDDAQVGGDARVSGNAQVSGDAIVYGKAKISDNAHVYGNAKVYDNASVYGKSTIYDYTRVSGNAQVYGTSAVYGFAWIEDKAQVFGTAHVCGDAVLSKEHVDKGIIDK